MDAIGGIYCAAHMKQRMASAGGSMASKDALQSTEANFMRDLLVGNMV